jgi:hypothetical protein
MVRKADMPKQKLTPEILAAAILGFEEQKRHIDSKIIELKSMLSGGPVATPEGTRRKGKIPAAVRRRMALGQKRRWAKIRGESEPATPETAKPKRRISEEGLKGIVAATKKRWRLAEAAKAQAAAKKAVPARKKAVPVKKSAPASKQIATAAARQ